jgi:hypothetical protein
VTLLRLDRHGLRAWSGYIQGLVVAAAFEFGGYGSSRAAAARLTF